MVQAMGEAGAVGRLAADCAAASSRTSEPAVSSSSGPGPASRLSSFFPVMDKEVPYLLSVGSSWASDLKAVSSRFSASASALSLDADSDSTSSTSPTEATAAVLKSTSHFGPWSGAKAALVLSLAVLTRYLTAWQLTTAVAASTAVFLATATNLTLRLRQFLQPWVLRRVETGTQTVAYIQVSWHPVSANSRLGREQSLHITGSAEVQHPNVLGPLQPCHWHSSSQHSVLCSCIGLDSLQTFRHPVMDTLMSAMAMTVSIEFYTAFLPVLFWVSAPVPIPGLHGSLG